MVARGWPWVARPLRVTASIGWSPVYGLRGPTPATAYLNALSGSSISDLYTVGAYNTVMRYGGGRWISVPLPAGKTWHLYGVWKASSEFVVAVGRTVPEDDENILMYDGSSWTPIASNSVRSLYGAWGSGQPMSS